MIYVGQAVRWRGGIGIVRKIDTFDGGHQYGVDIEVHDERGRALGWIAGCPERLQVEPVDEHE